MYDRVAGCYYWLVASQNFHLVVLSHNNMPNRPTSHCLEEFFSEQLEVPGQYHCLRVSDEIKPHEHVRLQQFSQQVVVVRRHGFSRCRLGVRAPAYNNVSNNYLES